MADGEQGWIDSPDWWWTKPNNWGWPADWVFAYDTGRPSGYNTGHPRIGLRFPKVVSNAHLPGHRHWSLHWPSAMSCQCSRHSDSEYCHRKNEYRKWGYPIGNSCCISLHRLWKLLSSYTISRLKATFHQFVEVIISEFMCVPTTLKISAWLLAKYFLRYRFNAGDSFWSLLRVWLI